MTKFNWTKINHQKLTWLRTEQQEEITLCNSSTDNKNTKKMYFKFTVFVFQNATDKKEDNIDEILKNAINKFKTNVRQLGHPKEGYFVIEDKTNKTKIIFLDRPITSEFKKESLIITPQKNTCPFCKQGINFLEEHLIQFHSSQGGVTLIISWKKPGIKDANFSLKNLNIKEIGVPIGINSQLSDFENLSNKDKQTVANLISSLARKK